MVILSQAVDFCGLFPERETFLKKHAVSERTGTVESDYVPINPASSRNYDLWEKLHNDSKNVFLPT